MKKYEIAVERYSKRYRERRSFFQKKIDEWKKKGSMKMHQHGQTLLAKADEYLEQLKEEFSKKIEDRDNRGLARQVRAFKKTYKELHEITKPIWQQWVEAIIIAGAFAFVLRTYVFGLYHVPTGSAEKTILVGDRIWGNKMAYLFNGVKRGDSVIFDKPTFKFDRSNPLRYFWQRYVSIPLPFFGLDRVPENWVKRVIGVPGDTVEGKIIDGKTYIYVNGKKLDQPFVNQYPLIRIRKMTGFLPYSHLGFLRVPDFLRLQSRIRIYTYDPVKSFEDQPFYVMKDEEIVRHLLTGDYFLEQPHTPSYDVYGQTRDRFGPFTIPKGKYWVMGDSRKNSEDSRYWGFLDRSLIHGRASFVIYSVDSEEPLWFFEMFKHPITFWTKYVRWSRCFKRIR